MDKGLRKIRQLLVELPPRLRDLIRRKGNSGEGPILKVDYNALLLGAVTVLLGGAAGFQANRSRVLAAGVEGLPGVVQPSSNYGQAAVAGDFNWDWKSDLVIGAPFYNATPLLFDSGMQVVLYGCTFCDGFESQNSSYWSTVTP